MITKDEFIKIRNSSLKSKSLLKDVIAIVKYKNKIHLLISQKDIWGKLKSKKEEIQEIMGFPVDIELYRIEKITPEIEKEFKETFGESEVLIL